MPDLVWDDKLAIVAANYAANCAYGHNANRQSDYAAQGGSGTVGTCRVGMESDQNLQDDHSSDFSPCSFGLQIDLLGSVPERISVTNVLGDGCW